MYNVMIINFGHLTLHGYQLYIICTDTYVSLKVSIIYLYEMLPYPAAGLYV